MSRREGDCYGVSSTFGAWLRQNREELRLTREEFALRIGCSVSTLRKIEDGERRPSAQIAELIAHSLKVPLEERATFVKVARGELNLERLTSLASQVTGSKVSSVSMGFSTNLPVLPTPLIGRQREVAELNHLLRDENCRLLTLTGPGGIGKTRLAIESASQIQTAFRDGVYFVPFAAVNSTRFIVPVIADTIGFTFQSLGGLDPQTQLFSYLRDKQALLVMDNLEQLLAEPGIEVLAELLAEAAQVKLLATSRESLGLQSEWVYEVQGLPVPDIRLSESSTQGTSVELFLQRARRAKVGFDPDLVDYAAIVRICQLVEGMPYVIEYFGIRVALGLKQAYKSIVSTTPPPLVSDLKNSKRIGNISMVTTEGKLENPVKPASTKSGLLAGIIALPRICQPGVVTTTSASGVSSRLTRCSEVAGITR